MISAVRVVSRCFGAASQQGGRCSAAARLLNSLVLLFVFVASPAWAGQDRSEYSLIFAKDSPSRFHVHADIAVSKNELVMAPRLLAEPLPNGWADFVENLSARDMAGRPVKLHHLGSGRWKLDRPVKRIRLDYDVALKHDQVKWSVTGLFARGYAVEDAMFFFGHVAFITGAPEFKMPAHIRFNLPKGWQAVTALPEAKGKKGVYEAKDWDGLILTGSMVGRLSKREIKSGPLELVLTAPRSLDASIKLMGNSLEPIIGGFVRDMGGAPKGKFGVFFSVSPIRGGGETTDNTVSMLFPKAPDMSTKRSWYIIAHEVFHLWNAVAIDPLIAEDSYWFMEGFSVHGASLGMYNAGLFSEQEFFTEIAEGYDKYLAGMRKAAGRVSLKESGKEKAKHYDIVYFGGMVAAIALDIEAKSRSAATNRGFTEMMRLAYEEFGKTGREYAYDDLVRLASQSVGADMTPFFARYVEGTEVISLPSYLKRAGLILTTVNGKSTITPDPNATAAQRSLFPPSRNPFP